MLRRRPLRSSCAGRDGYARMWRGAPAVLAAFVHPVARRALFGVRARQGNVPFGVNAPGHHPLAAAGTGALATLLHDAVLTPLDVVKQRLQLGFCAGARRTYCATSCAVRVRVRCTARTRPRCS